MKKIEDFSINDGDNTVYQSVLCSTAASTGDLQNVSLRTYINELCFSYVNHLQLVVDAYTELERILRFINSCDDRPLSMNGFSDYDLQTVQKENSCRDYSYLFITSMKSVLDIFACLVDTILAQTITEEWQMVSMRGILKRLSKQNYRVLHEAFVEFNNYAWIKHITDARNQLLHRGYRTKPNFDFTKSDELTIAIVKGNGCPISYIRIGQLFEDFMTTLPKMEEKVSQLICSLLPDLKRRNGLNFIYRSGGGVTEYSFNEII